MHLVGGLILLGDGQGREEGLADGTLEHGAEDEHRRCQRAQRRHLVRLSGRSCKAVRGKVVSLSLEPTHCEERSPRSFDLTPQRSARRFRTSASRPPLTGLHEHVNYVRCRSSSPKSKPMACTRTPALLGPEGREHCCNARPGTATPGTTRPGLAAAALNDAMRFR